MNNDKTRLAEAISEIELCLAKNKNAIKLYASATRAADASDEMVQKIFFEYPNVNSVISHFVLIPSIGKYTPVFDETQMAEKYGIDGIIFKKNRFFTI